MEKYSYGTATGVGLFLALSMFIAVLIENVLFNGSPLMFGLVLEGLKQGLIILIAVFIGTFLYNRFVS